MIPKEFRIPLVEVSYCRFGITPSIEAANARNTIAPTIRRYTFRIYSNGTWSLPAISTNQISGYT